MTEDGELDAERLSKLAELGKGDHERGSKQPLHGLLFI
ncbi:hypothetical protein SAMN04515648_0250 [Phyllobacterium sp. CL33Tsu]|nr:hypothetical protein SAMN04515648_0250 [Phyllobacterium sp. CL33Tsu]